MDSRGDSRALAGSRPFPDSSSSIYIFSNSSRACGYVDKCRKPLWRLVFLPFPLVDNRGWSMEKTGISILSKAQIRIGLIFPYRRLLIFSYFYGNCKHICFYFLMKNRKKTGFPRYPQGDYPQAGDKIFQGNTGFYEGREKYIPGLSPYLSPIIPSQKEEKICEDWGKKADKEKSFSYEKGFSAD